METKHNYQAAAEKLSENIREKTIFFLQGQNSLDFLEAVFEFYSQRQLFAISRPDTGFAGFSGHASEIQLPHSGGRTGWGKLMHNPSCSDAPAQIVFTSGTEGQPKRILLSHRNLSDVVLRLNEVMELTEEVREYIGVPVHYSFGLGRARAVSAAGGHSSCRKSSIRSKSAECLRMTPSTPSRPCRASGASSWPRPTSCGLWRTRCAGSRSAANICLATKRRP